jgi:hypothetical protein
MPGGPDHASPGHAMDDAQVSSHARVLARRRWGAASAGVTGAGSAGNGAAGDAPPHAHASASAAAQPKLAGWLPWLALGGSVAALIGAEVERRRTSDGAQANPGEAGIPFTAIVLYVLAALLAGLAIYLFLGRS